MVQKSECLCDGKIVGIETIYEVVEGDNINISGNIENLRTRSRRKELFCPCGCGTNFILVAGENQLKEQHFRIDRNNHNPKCTYKPETIASAYSKIVLKCWLDDKLNPTTLDSRVPIYAINDTNSKYEFTFLLKSKKLALSYHFDKTNLIDDKLDILESNRNGLRIIYVLDNKNRINNGQYPERLIKVQRKQGYCLFLELNNIDYSKTQLESLDYSKAKLIAAFYIKNARGKWNEIKFEEDFLKNYSFDISGNIIIKGETLKQKLDDAADKFYDKYIKEKAMIKEEKLRLAEEEAKQKKCLMSNEKKSQTSNFKNNLFGRSVFGHITISKDEINKIDITQRKENFIDENNNRWIKCKYCNEIKTEERFGSIGEDNIRNLGICYDCYKNPNLRDKFYRVFVIIYARCFTTYVVCAIPFCGFALS